ncbi:MAG: PDZ domain-containing protein [Planctomycetes bacterium]|nr:PDZ domain-containing protein [Planctomycetota bacterium]MBI3845050.1 PDZ domain-containing protein [Planctomycetota bacterium]
MKVRMVKTLLWSLNGLLTLAILGSVALFVIKSRSVQADRLSDLDAIAREAQSKARKGPAKGTKGIDEYKAIWDVNIRDLPPVVPVTPEAHVAPTTPPLEDQIVLRAIIGPTVIIEYKKTKAPDNPSVQLQQKVDLGKDIPDISPTATVAEIIPAPEPECVKFNYDGKVVTMSITRNLDAITRSILGGGKKPKNAPAGEGDLVESEDDQPFGGPAGAVPAVGRIPGGDPNVTETKEVKPGVWQISAAERDKIRDTAKDLLDQAEVSTYTNEKTHKNDGMKIDHIQSDSLLAQRGLQEGDLIKRINGTPVSSKTELINYVKDNQDRLQSVRVDIERKGKPMTLTYQIPK